MDLITTILIALGLSMDAFAVSIASGTTIKSLHLKHAFLIAAFFGSFQAIMPFIGWLAGLKLKELISQIDHWIVFGLLILIGVKMIYESTRLEAHEKSRDPLHIGYLFILAIATSIDALAVGISFALLKISLVTPLLIIGSVTFLLSFSGVYIGNRIGHFFEHVMEAAGGVVLIGIGTKILIQHLLFGG
jgi:putative Mn2+ efflux pump MntP